MAIADLVLLPLMGGVALVSRWIAKPIDVGLGPEPFISNGHHQRALRRRGYSAETFVDHVYYITTAFDVRYEWPGPLRYFARHALFVRACLRYRALFVHFTGGPLGGTAWLWRIEPWLLDLARVRVVVMPYGGDVQDLTRSPNLAFKQAMAIDYPGQRHVRRRVERKIDLWTSGADHVLAGCEWVDYLHSWDSLTLLHFPIDTDEWSPSSEASARSPGAPLRVVHAPNHRAVKGTRHLERAVAELREEGVGIELEIVERRPNAEVRRALEAADVAVDQLVIGWYAMFALEAMALGRPVLCFLRPDLVRFYEDEGLIDRDEIPIVRCDARSVKDALRVLAADRERLRLLGKASREYVVRRHSLDAVGVVTSAALHRIGVDPRGA